jgi:hypothetical protein
MSGRVFTYIPMHVTQTPEYPHSIASGRRLSLRLHNATSSAPLLRRRPHAAPSLNPARSCSCSAQQYPWFLLCPPPDRSARPIIVPGPTPPDQLSIGGVGKRPSDALSLPSGLRCHLPGEMCPGFHHPICAYSQRRTTNSKVFISCEGDDVPSINVNESSAPVYCPVGCESVLRIK